MKLIPRSEYAKKKGVSKQYIHELISKKKIIFVENPDTARYYNKLIVDCEENDKLFCKNN